MDQERADLVGVDLDVRLYREYDDPYDMLRRFSATISYEDLDASQPTEIGALLGWITWAPFDGDLADAGDAIGVDAEYLAWPASRILEKVDIGLEAVVLLDRAHLVAEWRGQRLLGPLLENFLGLFQLSREAVVVVTHPEPQKPEGGPYEYGPERDAAMARLCAANRVAGFQPWNGGPVWWRPIEML